MVADIESGKSVESKVRTSFGMFLNKAQPWIWIKKVQGRTRECGQMKRIENRFMLFLTWSIQEITRLTMISSQAFLGCLKECCMRSCRGVELRLSHT
ncbi:hypothetical protein ACSBR1_038724 [Camellia fascicularis]